MDRNYKIFHGEDVTDEGKYEVTWEQVRKQRDTELQNSDWRALKDVTLPNEWKDYRQALRDLPQDFNSANDAADNWPQSPE